MVALPFRALREVVVLIVAVALLAAQSASGSADSATPAAGPAPTPAAGAPTVDSVTLVTGHVVTIEQLPDGRRMISIDPDGQDVPVEFQTLDTGDGFYVLPLEAAPLVPGKLDPELFNIDRLTEVAVHVGEGRLPVIVQYAQSPGPQARAAPTRGDDRLLQSIDAVATTLDADSAEAFWDGLTGSRNGPAIQRSSTEVQKVWLDAVVTATLDRSVPRIGAPAAWDAAYDGSGVTVAVLDTGIDDSHPDLQGQVATATNFTTSDDGDGNGHGTHVASILAGTGAGADGLRTGVAPGATLVDGKVLGDGGSGLLSWVIAGMEWAVLEVDVDIVNLSLGAGPSDGLDPLSQSVNQLTEAAGTLFVVAAGNHGPQSRTVATPAAADAALAVGNVSLTDFVQSSSSRGPRRGDHAIKPEVTAPGVNIAAARAAGTSIGSPIDDLYTRATGTSMSSPHVAGAAAILAQQNPEWDVEALTAALVTTASPHGSFSVYDQGGGRVDVEAAIGLSILATPGVLNLGYFTYPHDDAEPASRDLTYTNLSDEPEVLDLALEITNEDGSPPADGMIVFTPDQLSLEPGQSATVTVTVDVTAGEDGLYGGYLTAARQGTPIARTPVGFHKEDERYELSILGLDADGNPATGASSASVMNVEDRDTFFASGLRYINGVASVRVPPGAYSIVGNTFTHDEQGEVTEVSAMAAPEVMVTEDTEVLLDARTANPISVDTPAHDTAPRLRADLTMFRRPETGPGFSLGSITSVAGRTFSAAPTEEVSIGFFEFVSRWQLADPDDPLNTPVLYDVVLPETAIPEDLSYQVHPDDLAANHQRFHSHVPDHPAREFRTPWRPWQTSAIAISEDIPAPGERTDYVASADTAWTRTVLFAPPGFSTFAARMSAPRMEFMPGSEELRTWFKQPATPGIIEGSPWHPSFPQFRNGDVLELFIAEYGDAQRGHWSFSHASIDDTAFRVFEDGELIAEAARPRGDFEVPPQERTIRLEVDTARHGLDWWQYSTRTRTAWTFKSSRPTGDTPELLPLLFVDYDLDVDLLNQAPAPRDRQGSATIELTVRHQPGFEDPPAIADLQLWTSGDDGATWRPVGNVRQIAPGQFRAILDQRDPDETNGYLALRVRAEDADGNRIEQEIERAFGLPDRD